MEKKNGRTRLVVIGNGMAASALLEELVKCGAGRFEITVFGQERHQNYNRVLLTQILTGEKALGEILLHEPRWYEKNGITLRIGVKVTRIERGRRAVVLEDGREVPYDRLVLATGSRPVIPAIPGAGRGRHFQGHRRLREDKSPCLGRLKGGRCRRRASGP